MLSLWRKSASREAPVDRLYAAMVARARDAAFFTRFGVPDTIDGRFDVLALHAWLVLDGLRAGKLAALSQALTDRIFTGFDEGLRDLGTGDMGMGRKIKKLADAFYGRLSAYDTCDSETAMTEAIERNIYRGSGEIAHAQAIARYAESARSHIARSELAGGDAEFGPLP
jgi:cytochrome b pre-mRNA-processing protein 3